VYLKQQEVTISEHGDWAEVQLYEVYGNVTFQRQEVVYYFSLPESAVVTGLWLGNSSDRSQAFAFQVAPRGAAQEVYQNEVRYRRDPALIEQIGPRQYRLRAFPIEPRWWGRGQLEEAAGPPVHLWMTYRTVSVDGSWPMPRLAEKFNVYWDDRSTRLVDGKPTPAGKENWLPDAVVPSQPVTPARHRVDFPGGISVLARSAENVETAGLPTDLRLAVVLDRSFSMRERAVEVKQALASLKQVASTGPEPDIYLTASVYRGEAPGKVGLASLNPDEVFYFGGQNAAELLAQFEELQNGEQYDLILVLTDGTGYELGEGDLQIAVPDAPLWVVHMGGGFPLGYDDPTQQAIQASGGGAASTVEEALSRYAVSRGAPGQVDEVDGYIWQTLPTSEADLQAGDFAAALEPAAQADGFAALAARRYILAEMAKNHASLDQLATLDQLHAVAVEQGIVTPYSSMLVLVNDSQQRLLDELSKEADRYGREVEDIGQTAPGSPFGITGVPEPEEWLLIILASLALAYVAWRKMPQKTIRV
jgi:putative PEP-CTERM system integral membrane protein